MRTPPKHSLKKGRSRRCSPKRETFSADMLLKGNVSSATLKEELQFHESVRWTTRASPFVGDRINFPGDLNLIATFSASGTRQYENLMSVLRGSAQNPIYQDLPV